MRLTPEQRKALIVGVGVKLANTEGLIKVTHRNISEQSDVPTSFATVKHYFPSRAELWQAVALHRDASNEVYRQAQNLGVL